MTFARKFGFLAAVVSLWAGAATASPSAVKRQNSRVLRPLRKTAGNRWHDRRERSRATLYRIGTPRAR
jgi:hypothetical protein